MAIKTNTPAYGNIFFQGETFDDLRSISPLKIRDGYSAIVRGQTTTSDGLGGLFAWKPTSTIPDDNETVIAPDAGGAGRWIKIAVGQTGPQGDTGPRGLQGLKGEPGGNVLSVGDFTLIGHMSIPAGTDLIQTSGRTGGLLIADGRLNDAQLAAYPRCVAKSANGRLFRRDATCFTTHHVGADATGATDAAPAIQEGIDYLDTFKEAGNIGSNVFFFSAGLYSIGSTLIRKSSDLIGSGSALQTVALLWTGGNGGTLMCENSAQTEGGSSFGSIQNIGFFGNKANNLPECLYDASTAYGHGIDIGFQLNRVMFDSASGPLVRIKGWTNLHWSHIRFDNAGTYCVEAIVPSGDTGRSFLIDRFTYDNKGKGQGLLKMTLSSGASVGVVEFAHGRIEINDKGWTGDKSVITVNSSQYLNASFVLNSVTFAVDGKSTDGGPFSLVKQIGAGPQPVSLTGRDLVFVNPGSWRASIGTPSYQYVPPIRSNMQSMQIGTTNGDTPSFVADLTAGQLSSETFKIGGTTITQWPNDSQYGAGRISVNGRLIARMMDPPPNNTSPGRYGDQAFKDNNDGTTFHYLCVADNKWARSSATGYRTDW